MRRNRITMLVVLFSLGCMMALGVILAASMQPSRDRSDQMAKLDISGMKPGELRKFDTQSFPVWVLRRTEVMLGAIYSNEHLLVDIYSVKTCNPWDLHYVERAHNAEYFVFTPWFQVVNKWNGVRSILEVVPKATDASVLNDINRNIAFVDNGDRGFYFDTSGRIFSFSRNQDGVSHASNLFVPSYVIDGERSILVNAASLDECIRDAVLPQKALSEEK